MCIGGCCGTSQNASVRVRGCCGLASCSGGVAILSITSCENRDEAHTL